MRHDAFTTGMATLAVYHLAMLPPAARRALVVSLVEQAVTVVRPRKGHSVNVSAASELVARLCSVARWYAGSRELGALAAVLARELEQVRYCAQVAHRREAEEAGHQRRRRVVSIDEHRRHRGKP